MESGVEVSWSSEEKETRFAAFCDERKQNGPAKNGGELADEIVHVCRRNGIELASHKN